MVGGSGRGGGRGGVTPVDGVVTQQNRVGTPGRMWNANILQNTAIIIIILIIIKKIIYHDFLRTPRRGSNVQVR